MKAMEEKPLRPVDSQFNIARVDKRLATSKGADTGRENSIPPVPICMTHGLRDTWDLEEPMNPECRSDLGTFHIFGRRIF